MVAEMVKDTKWREFEQLIAQIERKLAPNATVEHDMKLIGISGARHQIDVRVTVPFGIHQAITILECKRYQRPVGKATVEGFVTKLQDVRGHQGILVSSSGFSEDAKRVAFVHNIGLVSYSDATGLDWARVVGPEAWIHFIYQEAIDVTVTATFANGKAVQLPHDAVLVAPSTSALFPVRHIFDEVWPQLQEALGVGRFGAWVEFHDTVFSTIGQRETAVVRLEFSGILRANRHTLNLAIASGHILEDAQTGEPLYKEVYTKGLDWEQVLSSQPGTPLTQDDLERAKAAPGVRTFSLMPGKVKRYIRFVLTNQRKPAGN